MCLHVKYCTTSCLSISCLRLICLRFLMVKYFVISRMADIHSGSESSVNNYSDSDGTVVPHWSDSDSGNSVGSFHRF